MDISGWIVKFIDFIVDTYNSAWNTFLTLLPWAPVSTEFSPDSGQVAVDQFSTLYYTYQELFTVPLLVISVCLATMLWVTQFSKSCVLIVEDRSHIRLVKTLLRAAFTMAAIRLIRLILPQIMRIIAATASYLGLQGLYTKPLLSSSEGRGFSLLSELAGWTDGMKYLVGQIDTLTGFIIAILAIIFGIVVLGSVFIFLSITINRLIRIFTYSVFAPIGVAFCASEDTAPIGKHFAKSFLALVAEAVVIIVIVEVSVGIIRQTPEYIPFIKANYSTAAPDRQAIRAEVEREYLYLNINPALNPAPPEEELDRITDERYAQALKKMQEEGAVNGDPLTETLKFFARGLITTGLLAGAVKGGEKAAKEIFAGQ